MLQACIRRSRLLIWSRFVDSMHFHVDSTRSITCYDLRPIILISEKISAKAWAHVVGIRSLPESRCIGSCCWKRQQFKMSNHRLKLLHADVHIWINLTLVRNCSLYFQKIDVENTFRLSSDWILYTNGNFSLATIRTMCISSCRWHLRLSTANQTYSSAFTLYPLFGSTRLSIALIMI